MLLYHFGLQMVQITNDCPQSMPEIRRNATQDDFDQVISAEYTVSLDLQGLNLILALITLHSLFNLGLEHLDRAFLLFNFFL